jgi:hypothetical protein
MTETPPNRLWPLALMGWLAAFPPAGREAVAQPATGPAGVEAARAPGARTAWLRSARALYAPLSAMERAAIRRQRRRHRA